jgi:DEAD/DEAH box helicase domain-containing protein
MDGSSASRLYQAEIIVDGVDLEHGIASRMPSIIYGTPTKHSVQLIETITQTTIPGGSKCFGDIQVTSQVTGFRKVRWYTHEQLGFGDLDLPPNELQTKGYWITLAQETVNHLREENLWTNDPNQYGPGWVKVKEQVRARDKYRCQLCGIAEQGRAHDVHHKIPFRTYSSQIEANQCIT